MVFTSVWSMWVITSPAFRPLVRPGAAGPSAVSMEDSPTTSTPSENSLMPTAQPSGITSPPAPATAAAATASGLAGAAQTGLPGRRQASSRPRAAAPAQPGRHRCVFSCSNLIPPPDGQAYRRGHPVSGGQHRPPFSSMDRLCRRQTRGSLPPFPCETLETLPNCGRPGSHRKKSEILKFFQIEGRIPPAQTGCRSYFVLFVQIY